MPQRPTLRRRQKARRTKKLELWREKQTAQQPQVADSAKKPAQEAAKKPAKKD